MRLKFILPYCFIIHVFSLVTQAQCANTPEISITGGTCVVSVLTATSNVQGATIIWKKDGTTVATQTASIPNVGTTVAGYGCGSNASQLNNPNRIYIDASGNLYIPDMSNSRVQKWAPGATSGVTVAGGNGFGSAANQFDRPTSVALDSKGNIYVTDQTNRRIQKWVPGGSSGVTVAQGLSTPTGIFIDAQDNIYVSEQHGPYVTKWAPGATSGIRVAGSNYGSASNQLSTPTGIFVDAAGNIYICDTDNNRVQKWATGASSGTTVAGGNGFGSAANQLANPLGIYVDPSGNIYISDFNNYRVQKWAPGATSGITVAGGNGGGFGPNQLNQPAGIYMDANCNLYVSDFYNCRVQKFDAKATNTYTAATEGSYTASLVTATGVTVTSNTIKVGAPTKPSIVIKADTTTICKGGKATFTASLSNLGPGTPKLQWQKNGLDIVGASVGTDAMTFSDNNIVNGDVITCLLTANDVCLTSRQVQSNTVKMIVKEAQTTVSLGPDVFICPGEDLILDVGAGYSSYLWQDGSSKSKFIASREGQYYVKVEGACSAFASDTIVVKYYTDQQCLKKFYMPNSFTPNGDGKNEEIKPVFFGDVKLIRFDVYNRWGQLVFHTTSVGKGWNGKLNGKLQTQDVFVWLCTYQFRGDAEKTEKGVVTLIK